MIISILIEYLKEADVLLLFFSSSSLWDAVNVFGNPIDGDLLTTGTPLSSPPLIDLISNDPILREVKVLSKNSFISPCASFQLVSFFQQFREEAIDMHFFSSVTSVAY